MPWHKAYVQTLFNWKQAIHYFIVTLTNNANPLLPPLPVLPAPGRNAGEEPVMDNLYPHIPSTNTLTSTPAPSTTNNIITASLQRLQQLIKPPQCTQLDSMCHVSDLNPWFTQTGIYAHLQQLDLSQLGASYQLPKKEDKPILHEICKSITCIL
jgi:hypothetical protein